MPFLIIFFLLLFSSPCLSASKPVVLVVGDENAAEVGAALARKLPGLEIAARPQPKAGICDVIMNIPRKTELIVMVFGSYDVEDRDPWPESETWKLRLLGCMRQAKGIAGKAGARIIWAGPFPSPDREMNRRSRGLDSWMRTAAISMKALKAETWDDLANRRGEWEGFKNGVRLYAPDGKTLASGGADIVADGIIIKAGK